ncbi:MAG: hypothetical protein EOL98_09085 [Negativicutes bacterium]|nr:hypothetical protein [Negativicutes bacterium]
MNLFDQVHEETAYKYGVQTGFRLEKLEVYNWGTFDGKVWSFLPQGETSLLTGEVGSGKSTLVDALTTLLVSPRRVAYNKAADAGAKERTVTSYVRGYFGQKKGAEGYGQPDALRDAHQYSVILAVFEDAFLQKKVTLAQFFWYQEEQKPPSRLYVISERALTISKDFANFGKDVRVLKKRLQNSDAQVFDQYNRYAEIFRDKLGIKYEQALDLFQQTISMKKVEKLTDFVRNNMLQPSLMGEEVKKLINHFQDLNGAHEAVLKAKRQVALLQPIVEQGMRCSQLEKQQEFLQKVRAALKYWIAGQEAELLNKTIDSLTKEWQLASSQLEQAEKKQKDTVRLIKETERNIYDVGGGKLEALKEKVQDKKELLGKIRQGKASYAADALKLHLSVPSSIEEFIRNKQQLIELRFAEDNKRSTVEADYQVAAAEIGRLDKEIEKNSLELESLRSRRSSIPSMFIERRAQLCANLGIKETELPFVGELLEVKEDAEPWEGAIERLLHNFGLSLLVPEKHYSAVMQWVDHTNLKMKLVYYRVRSELSQGAIGIVSPQSVAEKLIIKPQSTFGLWLNRELKQRFTHVCCETSEQFRRETMAVTKAGQIKTKGNRHEKDDRYAINDRRQYILGFSNQKKIDALLKAEQKLQEEKKFYEEELKLINKSIMESQQRLTALSNLEKVIDYAEIDTFSMEKILAELEENKRILEEADSFKVLQKRLDDLEKSHSLQEKVLAKRRSEENNLSFKITEYKKRVNRLQITAGEATTEICGQYSFLEENRNKALPDKLLNLENANVLERDYGDWLSGEQDKLVNKTRRLRDTIIGNMVSFKNQYIEETRDIDASMESLSEYFFMKERLDKDGLPKFEKRFQQLLHENTLNQIALFQAKLKQEQDSIKRHIEQINGSLGSIDYSEGRFIRLEYEETYDNEIKSFRVELKACTEGALTGSEDEQYAEKKFLQVRSIIERFRGRQGETESDTRWTAKVIDVRNWFLFSASECWRETGEEYEHYTDSGGKSGGQKEKLAYTILAASLVYHFDLDGQGNGVGSFRFVVIDEAFLKSSDESARFGLELFKKLDLQLMIVTPLLKIPTIAQYIAHVGLVQHDDIKHQSKLRNISIEEYESERKTREAARSAGYIMG